MDRPRSGRIEALPLMLVGDGLARTRPRLLGRGLGGRVRGHRRPRGAGPRRGDRRRRAAAIRAGYRYRREPRSRGAPGRRRAGPGRRVLRRRAARRAEERRLPVRSERRSLHQGRRLLRRELRGEARVRRLVQVVGGGVRSHEHELVLRRPVVQRRELLVRAVHPVGPAGGDRRRRAARALVLLADAQDRVERVPVTSALRRTDRRRAPRTRARDTASRGRRGRAPTADRCPA